MSPAEVDEFLRSPTSTWLLKLAFLTEDGWPMIVPLWYQWDGSAFYVVGRKRSEWVAHLKRDPRCAICIEEQAHPANPQDPRAMHRRGRRRTGPGRRIAMGRRWPTRWPLAIPGPTGPDQLVPSYGWERYLVKLIPRSGSLTTWQGADWALRYFDPGQRPDLEARAEAQTQS